MIVAVRCGDLCSSCRSRCRVSERDGWVRQGANAGERICHRKQSESISQESRNDSLQQSPASRRALMHTSACAERAAKSNGGTAECRATSPSTHRASSLTGRGDTKKATGTVRFISRRQEQGMSTRRVRRAAEPVGYQRGQRENARVEIPRLATRQHDSNLPTQTRITTPISFLSPPPCFLRCHVAILTRDGSKGRVHSGAGVTEASNIAGMH